MSDKFTEAQREISANRKEIIEKLVRFALTDALLFWSHNDELSRRQEKLWMPVFIWARKLLHTEIVTTDGLDVPKENEKIVDELKVFLEKLSDKKLTALYLAALDMRSVILAMALVQGRLDAEEAYKAAWLEELWQAEKWGIDPEAESKRLEQKKELQEIEAFLKRD